jgi:hypothetical protein
VADDNSDRTGFEGGGRCQHVLDHRLAGHTMQHLHARGFHARAFTRREDDDVNVHEDSRKLTQGGARFPGGSIIARIAS